MIENFLIELKKKGWTQQQIAKACGLSQGMISKLRNGGNCDIVTAIKIADAFEISLDELVGRTTPKRPKDPPGAQVIRRAELYV